MARNRKELVDVILEQCKDIDQYDKPVQLQVLKETLTATGMDTIVLHYHVPSKIIVFLFLSSL